MSKIYIDNMEIGTPRDIGKLSFVDDKIPDYISSVSFPISAKAEMTVECDINVPMFEQLTGVDLSRGRDMTGCTVELSSPYKVQRRRNKKKRINKKWAKRYGYITKFKQIRIVDSTIYQRSDDFDIIGKPSNFVVLA